MKRKTVAQCKLIYNPQAGNKRKIIQPGSRVSLEEIKAYFSQYQITVDCFPTRGPKHARILAEESRKEGYSLVVAAGGDGTIAEVASGLVGSDRPLGIIPLGSFMNIARMLSIPFDIEKAIQLIKIKRIRKIDVGYISYLNGQKQKEPYYFFEEAGLGPEAQIHAHLVNAFEHGKYLSLLKIPKTIRDFYASKVELFLDGKKMETRALLITISNGPYGGAALRYAPKAKLNDRKLTVSLFKMTKWQLAKYFLSLLISGKTYSKKKHVYQAENVMIFTKKPKLIHADARVFGNTPVQFTVLPGALHVITGFPTKTDSSLIKRTYLDP